MRRKGIGRLAALILGLLLTAGPLGAAQAEKAFAPLPEEGAAPYPPVAEALGEDGRSYDDGTLRIRIEEDVVNDTHIYWVSVSLKDASQLRTALAGPRGSKKLEQPTTIARRANAVLALNGDFFTGHNSGVVYRQGELLRNEPAYTRDELLIDENGDLHILAFQPRAGKQVISDRLAAFQQEHRIVQAFCFGPGLIADGVKQEFNYAEKVSCGYPTRAQRIIFCQTGPLEYLFLVTEGKEQNQPGFTVPECVELLEQRGGILQAYNLDGGNSTQIILCGEKINARDYGKARDIADMIVFATLRAPEE